VVSKNFLFFVVPNGESLQQEVYGFDHGKNGGAVKGQQNRAWNPTDRAEEPAIENKQLQ